MKTCFFVTVIFLLLHPFAFCQELGKQITDFRRLSGPGNVEKIISVGEELQRQYADDPVSLGKVMGNMADILASSGIWETHGIASDYAHRALELPLPTALKLKMHIIIGGATQAATRGVRGEELAKFRSPMAQTYLEGLRIALDEAIPRERKRIDFDIFDHIDSDGIVDPTAWELFFAAEQHVDSLAITNRKALENQLVHIYTRVPYATEELRRLALEILEDEEAVEYLVSRVEEQINEKLTKDVLLGTVEVVEDVVSNPDITLPTAPLITETPSEIATADSLAATTTVPNTVDEPFSLDLKHLFIITLVLISTAVLGIATWRNQNHKDRT